MSDQPTTHVVFHELPEDSDVSNLVAIFVIVVVFMGGYLFNHVYHSFGGWYVMFLDWLQSTRPQHSKTEQEMYYEHLYGKESKVNVDDMTEAEVIDMLEKVQMVRDNALRLKQEGARIMAAIQRELEFVQ